jgi:hypothetical protein
MRSALRTMVANGTVAVTSTMEATGELKRYRKIKETEK